MKRGHILLGKDTCQFKLFNLKLLFRVKLKFSKTFFRICFFCFIEKGFKRRRNNSASLSSFLSRLPTHFYLVYFS